MSKTSSPKTSTRRAKATPEAAEAKPVKAARPRTRAAASKGNRAAADMAALCQVIERLDKATSLQDAIKSALDLIRSAFGWAYGSYWALDPKENALRFALESGSVNEEFRRVTLEARFREGEGLSGRAWRQRDVFFTPDIGQMTDCCRAPVAQRAGVKSGVCFPILVNGQVQGTMDFFTLEEVTLTEERLNILRNVGRLVSAAVTRCEAARVSSMMDQAPVNVMFADRDFKIQYINPISVKTLKTLEKYLPVKPEQMVGQTIDVFHKRPEHQRKILSDPNNLPHRTNIQVGPETLDLLVSPVYDQNKNYLGAMVTWEVITKKLKTETEMARVMSMMDQAPVNVMFADRDFKIQYINPASVKTLKTLEKLLPVKADQMVGQVIDVFHKRPEHQRKILSDPNNLPHRTNIQLGEDTLDLLVSPIYDQNKNYLGAMVTWEVITKKLAMERQVKENAEREKAHADALRANVNEMLAAVNAVARNDYSKQISVTGDDAIGQLGQGLQKFFVDKKAADEKAAALAEAERRQGEELRRKVDEILKVVNAVAQGDFTAEVADLGDDAVGQMAASLNVAITSIRTALSQAREVADAVATASSQLSGAAEQISSGSQEQASSLEETASSLEEMTSTVKQNSDNAQQARQLASNSRDVAEKGGQVVSSAVEAMSEINKSSKKIADIITTIDEIAFQTNLLALNAAVEAARAGEQGRGFAVVAAEVRNLAQRSATAAKEIKGLIQDSVRKVENGSDLVNKSGQTLQEIVSSVKRVTDIVTEIAAASKEQSAGIDQVNKAVTQMDAVTQTNASQTEELSGTAQALSSQAEELQGLIGRFKLDDGAAAPAAKPTRQPAKKPAPARKPAAPAKKAAAPRGGHELDLIGTQANGHGEAEGGFQEF